jgi:hypothetical protein
MFAAPHRGNTVERREWAISLYSGPLVTRTLGPARFRLRSPWSEDKASRRRKENSTGARNIQANNTLRVC